MPESSAPPAEAAGTDTTIAAIAVTPGTSDTPIYDQLRAELDAEEVTADEHDA